MLPFYQLILWYLLVRAFTTRLRVVFSFSIRALVLSRAFYNHTPSVCALHSFVLFLFFGAIALLKCKLRDSYNLKAWCITPSEFIDHRNALVGTAPFVIWPAHGASQPANSRNLLEPYASLLWKAQVSELLYAHFSHSSVHCHSSIQTFQNSHTLFSM